MNSPGDGFVPLREKVAKRPTPPWYRFIAPRENDAHKLRECSSRNIAFSLGSKFTPPNDKDAWKVTVPRKKANKPVFLRERVERRFPRGGFWDRVVPLCKIRFMPENTPPKGRFFLTREKIIDNFTFLKEKAGEGHVLPVRSIFLRGGPTSPRYKIMSHIGANSLLQKIWWETNLFFQGRGLHKWKGL